MSTSSDESLDKDLNLGMIQDKFEQGLLTLPMHRTVARETATEFRRWIRLGQPALKRSTLLATFAQTAETYGGPTVNISDYLSNEAEDKYRKVYGNRPSSAWTEIFDETRYVDAIQPSSP